MDGRQDGADAAGGGSLRWRFANVVLDERSLELQVGGEPASLERKSLELLRHLLHHAGEVVTKDELFATVWPGRVVSDSVLTKCMSRIRAALGDAEQALIRTIHGYGYRLTAEVQVEQLAPAAVPKLDLQPGGCPPLRPHWRLVERLGSGGHGEAWLARHDRTGECRVYKFALDAAALNSLKREITLFRFLRDSLGRRDDLVDILDWNLEEPPCYIECEHVAGGNLAQWADAQGGIGRIPQDRRLALLAAIADTLAATHAVGVLHKDLKPANVLVDTRGNEARVRLCDFGSGGVVDMARLERLGITRLGFTRTVDERGSTSGTPLYLAPEILTGQPATVQGDIYALGVMLYQMLVGDFRKALAPGWEADIADELLRADIAAAADGNPRRRLADAAQLAGRLRTLDERRQRRTEALAAEQRAARTQRLRVELRRLRAAAALMLALALAATAAGLVAHQARNQAVAAQNEALDARRQAEQAGATARAVSNFMNDELLGGIRRAPQPRSVNFESILEQAAGRIDQRFADLPEAAAEVHFLFARRFVTRRDRSLSHLEQAARLFAQAQGAQGDGAIAARITLADQQMHSGQFAAALVGYEAATLAVTARYGRDHLITLATQSAREFVRALGEDPGSAFDELLQLPARMQAARRPGPDDAWYTARIHFMPEPAKAAAHLQATARLNAVWALLQARSRLDEAERLGRDALASLQDLHGGDSLHAALANALLAQVLLERDEIEEAGRLFAQYRRIVEPGMNPQSFWRVFVIRDQGLLRLRQQRPREATDLLRQALEACPDFSNCSAIEVMRTHELLAEASLATGELSAAIAQFEAALSLRQRHQGAGSPWTVIPRIGLAQALRLAGRPEQARASLAAIDDALLARLPPDSLYRADLRQVRDLLQ